MSTTENRIKEVFPYLVNEVEPDNHPEGTVACCGSMGWCLKGKIEFSEA